MRCPIAAKVAQGQTLRSTGTNLELSLVLLSGPIPEKLRKHPRFRRFHISQLTVDGPPLPAVRNRGHAIKILALPVVLGYADLASNLFTAVSYFNTGHPVWFGIGLVFALGPALILSAFFLPGVEWHRRVLVATQLSLMFEAKRTVSMASYRYTSPEWKYSPVLALARVVEPFFQSAPQLILQLYAMLTLWTETSSSPGRLAWRVASVCISVASLAYAATDIFSAERLLYRAGGGNDTAEISRVCKCLPCLTGAVFSRVPADGTPIWILGFGEVHPSSHVWICFLYHILEIVSRFISLVMMLLVIRGWFFLALLYLWTSRGLIVGMAAWITAGHRNFVATLKALDFRFRVRLVAMPFLDSVMDGTRAFRSALALTLLEFIISMGIYHGFVEDNLPASARLTLTCLAGGCMVGKMLLAWVAISPLKEDENGSGNRGADEARDRASISGASESVPGSAQISGIEGGMAQRGRMPVPRVVEGPVRW